MRLENRRSAGHDQMEINKYCRACVSCPKIVCLHCAIQLNQKRSFAEGFTIL